MNAELVYSHVKDGVTFVRYRRALRPVDVAWDNVIHVDRVGYYVWAMGGTATPTASCAGETKRERACLLPSTPALLA